MAEISVDLSRSQFADEADAMSDFDVIGEFEKQARQQEQNDSLRQQLKLGSNAVKITAEDEEYDSTDLLHCIQDMGRWTMGRREPNIEMYAPGEDCDRKCGNLSDRSVPALTRAS